MPGGGGHCLTSLYHVGVQKGGKGSVFEGWEVSRGGYGVNFSESGYLFVATNQLVVAFHFVSFKSGVEQ